MWQKLMSRRYAIQIAIAWNNALQLMQKVYGISIQDILSYWDGQKTDFCPDQKQWSMFREGMSRLLEPEEIITTLPHEAKKFLEQQLREIRKTIPKNMNKLSNQELSALYNKIAEKNSQFYTRMWIIFLISEPLEEKVRAKLLKVEKDERKVDQLLLLFSEPEQLNDAMKERVDLLTIALQKRKITEEQVQTKLLFHWKKYRHIPLFDPSNEPFTIHHFQQELEKIKSPELELKTIKESLRSRKMKFKQELKSFSAQSYLYKLIIMLKEVVFVRDYRDGLRQKLNLTLKNLYEEIAKRANVTTTDIAFLTNQEIIGFLQNKITTEKLQKDISRRQQQFLLIQRGENITIYSGQDVPAIAARELQKAQPKEVNEIKGIIGSPGVAKGKAIIIHNNSELQQIKPGSVLVAHMTRQDYVPFMRKCVAFVTDEGGVTCHTAIIARELKIPCIVGTNRATEVFKTGDMVEVDANKGIVRKLPHG